VSGWVYIPDSNGSNNMLLLGNGADLKIYHSSGNNYIDSAAAQTLFIRSSQLQIKSTDGGETSAIFNDDGDVKLYYDNSLKLNTQANGVTVTGGVYSDGLICGDNEKVELGTGGDLQIYHNGSHSYIKDAGTGDVNIISNTIQFSNAANDEFLARFVENGAVELYYDGTKRAYTTDHGFEAYKSANCSGKIGTSTSGHYFESQSDDTTHGFEIHQKHGSNTSRASLAVYDNRTGSKSLAFYVRGDGETFSHPNDLSDRALKDNITDMATSYTKIKNLRPVNFTWKNRVDTEGNPVSKSISGFIAQEVEEQIPNLINGEEGSKGINSAGLVAHLTKALQEAITKIETLETKVAALEAK